MSLMGHQPPSYRRRLGRLECGVNQPVVHRPGDRSLSAYSVEKLCLASGAKIHEEFDSILRAIASNG